MTRSLLFVLMTFLAACSSNGNIEDEIDLSNEEDWIYQVDSLIMPYWMMDEAFGVPSGNYNTFRASDGSVIQPDSYDYSQIPEYMRDYIITGTDSLQRRFVRMNCRQIYAYCIAFHVSGNEQYLVHAKQGLDYLIEKGVFEDSSVVTYFINGQPQPAVGQRTVQDLAYGLLGSTIYYYLTRNPKLLELILPIKRQIMEMYYHQSDLLANSKVMKWTLMDYEADSAHHLNLLAPMDMINAHLLLMAMSVPDSLKSEYTNDLDVLAGSIVDNFYNEWSNSFLGNLNDKTLFSGSSDLGHSIKNFWMLYLVAQLTGDEELAGFAKSNGTLLLEKSFITELGRWGSMYLDSSLNVDPYILGWQYAEFDQVATTFSLADKTFYDQYLRSSFKVYYDRLIDHQGKETYWGLNDKNEPYNLGFKVGMWKNGFHSMEHALIGLVGTSSYYDQETKLYFAINESIDIDEVVLNPYYFRFDNSSQKLVNSNSGLLPELQIVEVTYPEIF